MKTWFQKMVEKFEGDPEYEFEKALLEFEEKIAEKIKPMPPEFAKLVSKHFWELLEK